MSSSHPIKQILQALNAPPLNLQETLLSLSSKTNIEKLLLINTIFDKLDSSLAIPPADIQSLPLETLAQTFLQTLNVLQYNIPQQYVESFADFFETGDIQIFYDILHYLTSNIQRLTLRAHTSRYLKPLDIPSEYIDPTLRTYLEQLSAAQEQWKVQHKALQQQQKEFSSAQLLSITSDLQELSHEKEQLTNKLERLRERIERSHVPLDGSPDNQLFQQLLTVTHTLRLQQEEEEQLYHQNTDIQQKLEDVRQQHQQQQYLLHEIQEVEQYDAQSIVERLRQQVSGGAEVQSLQRLDQHLRELEKIHRTLQVDARVMTSGGEDGELINEQQLMQLEQEYQHLTDVYEQHAHEQAQREAQSDEDGKLTFLREKLTALEKRQIDKLKVQHDVEQEHRNLQQELDALQQQLQSLSADSSQPVFTEQKFRVFLQSHNEKLKQYQALKAQMDELQEQMKQVEHCQLVLSNLPTQLDSGLSEEQLQALRTAVQVNEQYQSTEFQHQQSGKSQQQLQQLYKKLQQQLADLKAQVNPKVNDLRTAREQASAADHQYKDRCRQYAGMKVGYETERIKLQNDKYNVVQALQTEQSLYAKISHLDAQLKVRQQMVQQEQQYQKGQSQRLNDSYQSYSVMYKQEIQQAEQRYSELKLERQQLKETHGAAVEQRQTFVSLKQLMELKKRTRPVELGQSQIPVVA